jgi:hypothetical protein
MISIIENEAAAEAGFKSANNSENPEHLCLPQVPVRMDRPDDGGRCIE